MHLQQPILRTNNPADENQQIRDAHRRDYILQLPRLAHQSAGQLFPAEPRTGWQTRPRRRPMHQRRQHIHQRRRKKLIRLRCCWQAALSQEIYETVNNGVYRAGFATSQSSYQEAFQALFATLDTLEERLSENGPYLFGEAPVETDWRLFCTLVRFDAVYHGHFKCNLRKVAEYPTLQAYLERLYRLPGIADTVDFDHIKRHYYVTHDDINPSRIVPSGPELPWSE